VSFKFDTSPNSVLTNLLHTIQILRAVGQHPISLNDRCFEEPRVLAAVWH
jgi:hypothetical protein